MKVEKRGSEFIYSLIYSFSKQLQSDICTKNLGPYFSKCGKRIWHVSSPGSDRTLVMALNKKCTFKVKIKIHENRKKNHL